MKAEFTDLVRTTSDAMGLAKDMGFSPAAPGERGVSGWREWWWMWRISGRAGSEEDAFC